METPPFDLTTEQKDLLQSLSQETGKPICDLIAEALATLERRLRPSPVKGTSGHGDEKDAAPSTHLDKHIWEIADELLAEVPQEDLDDLPTDGAAQVDHYIYGLPKR